jgi:hypothetical protein
MRYEATVNPNTLVDGLDSASHHIWFQLEVQNEANWTVCDEGFIVTNVGGGVQYRSHRGTFPVGACVGTVLRLKGLTEGWYGGLSIAELEVYDRWTKTAPNQQYQLELKQNATKLDTLNRFCSPDHLGVVQFQASCWLNCPAAPLVHEEGAKVVDVWVERRAGRQGQISAEVVIMPSPLPEDALNRNLTDASPGVDFGTKLLTLDRLQELKSTSGRYVLNWADGDCEPKRFSLQLHDDEVYEGGERILLKMVSPGIDTAFSAGSADTQEIIITDENDKYPGMVLFGLPHTLVAPEQNVSEVVFTVLRLGGSDGSASVRVSTLDFGSATADSDFVSKSDILRWEHGDGYPKEFRVSIIDDDEYEMEEYFNVVLSDPEHVFLGPLVDQRVIISGPNDAAALTAWSIDLNADGSDVGTGNPTGEITLEFSRPVNPQTFDVSKLVLHSNKQMVQGTSTCANSGYRYLYHRKLRRAMEQVLEPVTLAFQDAIVHCSERVDCVGFTFFYPNTQNTNIVGDWWNWNGTPEAPSDSTTAVIRAFFLTASLRHTLDGTTAGIEAEAVDGGEVVVNGWHSFVKVGGDMDRFKRKKGHICRGAILHAYSVGSSSLGQCASQCELTREISNGIAPKRPCVGFSFPQSSSGQCFLHYDISECGASGDYDFYQRKQVALDAFRVDRSRSCVGNELASIPIIAITLEGCSTLCQTMMAFHRPCVGFMYPRRAPSNRHNSNDPAMRPSCILKSAFEDCEKNSIYDLYTRSEPQILDVIPPATSACGKSYRLGGSGETLPVDLSITSATSVTIALGRVDVDNLKSMTLRPIVAGPDTSYLTLLPGAVEDSEQGQCQSTQAVFREWAPAAERLDLVSSPKGIEIRDVDSPCRVFVTAEPVFGLQANEHAADSTRPELRSFFFDAGAGNLRLHFTEPVNFLSLEVGGIGFFGNSSSVEAFLSRPTSINAYKSIDSGPVQNDKATQHNLLSSGNNGAVLNILLSESDQKLLAELDASFNFMSEPHIMMAALTVTDTSGNSLVEIERGAAFLSDAVDCTACPEGFFTSRPCTDGSARECTACSVCPTEWYQHKVCSKDRDAVCMPCTQCRTGQFFTTDCSPLENRVCSPCKLCSPEEYETRDCAIGLDRLCLSCDVCSMTRDQEVYCSGSSLWRKRVATTPYGCPFEDDFQTREEKLQFAFDNICGGGRCIEDPHHQWREFYHIGKPY